MGRTTRSMAILLYCIRYPVKPFLALPSGFLLRVLPSLSRPPRTARNRPQLVAVSRTHGFSHCSITGRIRADSQKLESRARQPLSIRKEPPRLGQRCARADGRAISRPSNRLLRRFAGHSAIRARQAAISDQAAYRRPRRILGRRRRAPNRDRPHAPGPLSRSYSASPRRSGPRLQ